MKTCNELTAEKKEQVKRIDFEKASVNLRDVIIRTSLIHSRNFSDEYQNEVYLKPENLQKTGAFKIRGAYNKISKLTEDERKRGLIASSAGNHAQGVAYAANQLGVSATIVMPKTTPLIKVEATKKLGAKVVLSGDCYDEAYQEALLLQEKNNYVFIHPFNDVDIIEGQGTIGLEIIEELPDVDCVLVPVGGGGLISGIAMAIKKNHPHVKIIGVEPKGAMAMKISLENNEISHLEEVCTIADGVAVKRPGDLTFPLVQEYVDEIVSVSDFEIMECFLVLLERHKLIGENAGVLSLAGLKKIEERNKKIVCLISGGNIDVLTVSSMIDRGLISRGRIFRFAVDLPDKPGELVKISRILADCNANVIKLDHNQFKTIDRFLEVELDVTVETNGYKHIEEIKEEFIKHKYIIKEI
ncbi:MAG: threonine ammonia-lyase [Clostridia bacterium]|nr:threonine ammonia-lyase [Clostridia bacterium]